MRLSTLWPTCQKPFILLLALFFVFFSSLFGQAGSLDISFGDSGKTVTNFHYTDHLYAAVVQLDDKIVVAGTTFNDSANIYSFALVRYQRNGKIDSSFGNYGKVTTSLGEQSSARALLLQQDGKLIVVGSVPILPSYNYAFALVRYQTNGTIDSSFGINGKATQGFIQKDLIAYSASLQADGKILCGGGANGTFTLIRFQTDGSVDPTFGQNGVITITSSPFLNAAPCNSVLVQTDGKIVGVAGADSSNNHGFFIARFLASGLLDSSFGNNGHLFTILQPAKPYYDCYASDVKQQADGKLVVCGTLTTGVGNSDFAVVRYLANGSSDLGFGSGGKVVTDFGGKYDDANSIAIQPDNKIIVVGDANQNIFSDFSMVRYLPNGALDATFGNSGLAVVSEGKYFDYARSANLQSDGKIVLAGYGDDGTSGDNFIVSRVYATAGVVLPISKLNITASNNQGVAVINWQTCNENNIDGFYVEKERGDVWVAKRFVPTKGNNNGCSNIYSFSDSAPVKGINYYRLKQVDIDGKIAYSQIVEVEIINKITIKISPNPVKDVLQISGLETEDRLVIQVINAVGQILKSEFISPSEAYVKVDKLTKGIYYLKITGSKNSSLLRFVKQ